MAHSNGFSATFMRKIVSIGGEMTVFLFVPEVKIIHLIDSPIVFFAGKMNMNAKNERE